MSQKREQNTYIKEVEISCKKDLDIKVNRSSKAVLKVPELGVEITPGPAESDPIKDIKDVILRIEKILLNYVEESEKKTNLLQKITEIKSGNKEATLIIEDPTGETIIGEKNE
ncbi:hypothetical protein [Methanonatronarchaeum sp. AMET-Sl]|uniref:hypothetical protein n=1 Tax=Methanonatronarchaeum sp. AMET-Sl TaxID=3037654 RepID=UPI00244DC1B5|nr:hypothetical protein [Methanonatronarchaeum sp. AMET-Sl]WGI16748.1 hypothetical protein QEN48_04440 [Methanonatronarchaeum sp. AMET-Sl]